MIGGVIGRSVKVLNAMDERLRAHAEVVKELERRGL
jgi:hypothetical protein